MRPALLTSDVHLSPEQGEVVSHALARLIEAHPGADVHLVGDIFDLSQTPWGERPAHTLGRILATHGAWVKAGQKHLAAGGRICFVLGNHDADLGTPDAAEVLRTALKPPDERQLTIAPWFCRHGSVHIEHGHLYDPDCAPDHPLSTADARSEGLGTALVRRFLTPSRALEFAHAHELTPRAGLHLAAKKWKARTPAHVLWYFRTAARLCLETLTGQPIRLAARAEGTDALPHHAERTGLPIAVLEELLAAAPRPTHDDFKATFLRLYFDRILAGSGAGLGASLLAASAAAPPLLAPGAITTALGLGYLYASGARTKRHQDGPVEALAVAAARIRAVTDCSLVVFGHSHVATQSPGYVNLGSFAFAEGERPYLVIDDAGRPEPRGLASA